MTIRRIDAFFTTHLTLDKGNIFNSTTNIAFSALQHLIGKHKYECLKGKTTAVLPVNGAPLPSSFIDTMTKVLTYICALLLVIPLTPIGIMARSFSFRSPEVNQAYSQAFLFQIPPEERTSRLMTSAFDFMRRMPDKERLPLLQELPVDLCASFLSLTNQEFTNNYLLPLPAADRAPLLKQLPLSKQAAFLSLDANRAFAISFLLQMPKPDRTPLLILISRDLHVAYQKISPKKEELDKYLGTAITFLNRLDAQLRYNPNNVQKWLTEASRQPLYPFPFFLAQNLEGMPDLKIHAEKFMALRQSCSERLDALGLSEHRQEELLQRAIQAESKATMTTVFQTTTKFIVALQKKLQNPDVQSAEIKEWLDGQKNDATYFYPFYTYPRMLTFMLKLDPDSKKLKACADLFEACETKLKANNLANYLSETSEHEIVNKLMQALEHMENIANLQALITKLSN